MYVTEKKAEERQQSKSQKSECLSFAMTGKNNLRVTRAENRLSLKGSRQKHAAGDVLREEGMKRAKKKAARFAKRGMDGYSSIKCEGARFSLSIECVSASSQKREKES